MLQHAAWLVQVMHKIDTSKEDDGRLLICGYLRVYQNIEVLNATLTTN
jgi:hypothetical protein